MRQTLFLVTLVILALAPCARAQRQIEVNDALLSGSAAAPVARVTPIASVLSIGATLMPDVVIQSTNTLPGTTEVTGNNGVPTAAPLIDGTVGVSVLNWSTTADVYCCYGDSYCNFGAGIHHGWPILRQPSSGNYNWQYFPLAGWQQLYCVATAGSTTINVIKIK